MSIEAKIIDGAQQTISNLFLPDGGGSGDVTVSFAGVILRIAHVLYPGDLTLYPTTVRMYATAEFSI